MALQYQSNKSLNFLVFHTSSGISSRMAALLILIFVSTTLSSFWVNSANLMPNWLLMVFMIGLSVSLGDFPNKFLKCSFYMCICSYWLAAFSLGLEVLFLYSLHLLSAKQFYRISNFIDLALNVFYLLFLVCIN